MGLSRGNLMFRLNLKPINKPNDEPKTPDSPKDGKIPEDVKPLLDATIKERFNNRGFER